MEKFTLSTMMGSSKQSKSKSTPTMTVRGGVSKASKVVSNSQSTAHIQRANLFNMQGSSRQGLERRFGGGGTWRHTADNENIYLQAEFIMEMLAKQQISITTLNVEQKMMIFLKIVT